MDNKFYIEDLCMHMPDEQQDLRCVDKLPLAMAYVPMQKWRDLYDVDVGLSRGTVFSELDLPFLGKRAIQK